MPQQLLVILKFISLMLTGVFGCLALLTEYKDKTTGKITRYGYTALVGIIASTILTGTLQYIEYARDRERANAEREQTLQLLARIDRTLSQIGDIVLDLKFEVSLDKTSLKSYKNRIENEAKEVIEGLAPEEFLSAKFDYSPIKKNGARIAIRRIFNNQPVDPASLLTGSYPENLTLGSIFELEQQSTFLPNPNTEATAFATMRTRVIYVKIYHRSNQQISPSVKDVDSLREQLKSRGLDEQMVQDAPDLSFQINIFPSDSEQAGKQIYHYYGGFFIQEFIGVNPINRVDSGRIKAVPDLAGARLVLLPARRYGEAFYGIPDLEAVRLTRVTLKMAQGYARKFEIDESKLKLIEQKPGRHYYEYIFPENISE